MKDLRLVVVDDYPLEGKTIEFLLRRDRPEIQYCGQALNGETGKELILQSHANIAVVDVKMPGVDGLTLLGTMKGLLPNLNVIILSAFGDFAFVQSAIRLGACDYLLKPLNPEELYQAIDKIVNAPVPAKANEPEPAEKQAGPAEISEELIWALKAGDVAESKERFRMLWETYTENDQKALWETKLMSKHILTRIFEEMADDNDHQGSKPFQNEEAYLYQHYMTQLPAILDMQTLYDSLLEYIQSMAEVANHRFTEVGEEQIERAKAIIEKNIGNKLSLTMVAQEIYISSFYLSSLFKKRTGMNFIDYVIERRIEKAKQMLCTTNETIETIAAQVGYDESNYFRRLFKKKVGLTPREYRRKRLLQKNESHESLEKQQSL